MDLKKDLQNLASQSRTSQPDITKSFDQSIDDLSRSGVATRALGIGNQTPDFELPSCKGSRVRLSDRLATGPVVISFYRGAWCPFCTLEIQALGESVKAIEDLGASLLAISPQSLEAACKTAEDNGIPFDLLSDERNDVAREFGIVFHLQDEIQSIYKEFGLDLALVNGDDSFDLPVPATYILDGDGTIRLAFVDPDYTRRLDPSKIINTLRELRNTGKKG